MRNRIDIRNDLEENVNEAELVLEVLLDIRDFVSISLRDLSSKDRIALADGIDDKPEERPNEREEDETGEETGQQEGDGQDNDNGVSER